MTPPLAPVGAALKADRGRGEVETPWNGLYACGRALGRWYAERVLKRVAVDPLFAHGVSKTVGEWQLAMRITSSL